MLEYYDDDCFITRNGKKIAVQGRYFLNFRNKKVKDYLSKTINRMVLEYGAQYIKLDYNQDLGIGTDKDSDSLGDGLRECSKAYLEWVDEMKDSFPDVLFETCSSGGMRCDYETLKHFSIVSTSDQTNYKMYPYIVGNVLSAILPEQAAAWSYPVDVKKPIGEVYEPSKEWVDKNITNEQIVFNMINSLLGRMHLASRINLLSDEKRELVIEGIKYYEKTSKIKCSSLPYFPLGFTDFSKKVISCGLIKNKTIYLAVWNLSNKRLVQIPIDKAIKKASVSYPSSIDTPFEIIENKISLLMDKDTARFFEITID